MRKWITIPALLVALALEAAGTPQQAAAVKRAYETESEAWEIKLKLAGTPEERAELAGSRPDAGKAARQMWSVVGGDLNKEWSLEPAAWFLRAAVGLVEIGEDGLKRPAMKAEIDAVLESVETHHLKSPELAPMCMALVALGGNSPLNLLRKVVEQNPDPQIGGVAALGIAMLSKNFGDDPRMMRERLTMLRKAIIEASDVDLGGTTVAEMAEEELYVIQYLTKGQQAPDLVGVDSGGRPMKLSDYSGKVVMLVFWRAGGDDAEGLIELMKATRADPRFAGDDFEIIGVNADPTPRLREMQKSGEIDWPNFSDPEGKLAEQYRVPSRPLAYVLGPDRTIHYSGTVGTFAELTAAAVLGEQ